MTLPSSREVPSLGRLLSEYRHGRSTARKALVLGPVVIAIGVVFLLVPVFDASGQAGLGTTFGVMALGLGLCAIGAALPISWYRHRDRRIELYDRGVVEALRGRRRSVAWDDVERLRVNIATVRMNGISTGTVRRYHLETSQGEELVLDERLEGIQKLGALVDQAVTSRIGPRVREQLLRGDSVSFGPFTVSSEGLSCKDKRLPWPAFAGHSVQQGWIRILERGKRRPFASQRYAVVPNATVFLAELSRMTTAAATA